MNKYLEKIAQSRDENKVGKAAAGAAATVGGAAYAKHQYDRGHITGRETLYHGTTEEIKHKIHKEGLRPNASKGIIDEAEAVKGKGALKSEGLSFMTKSKSQAHMYANQARRIHEGTFNILDIAARMKDGIPTSKSRKGIVHINAPTWKKDEFKKVRNPEIKSAFRGINQDFFTPKPMKKYLKTTTFKNLEKDVFVNKGTVSNKYMKGSEAYTKNSIGEIKDFVKAHPKRFMKGVGKSLLGTAIAGAGAYYASKQVKK